jgi:lipopolysaccharide export system permease protein
MTETRPLTPQQALTPRPAKMIGKYIFFELLPVFVTGTFLFVFILFVFQSVKLSEYVIVHDASLALVAELFLYFIIGFFPVVLPTALLFAVLMVYGRLSNDSELVAMKAIGIRPVWFSLPAWALGALVTLFAWQIATTLAPWGQRRADEIVHQIRQQKPAFTFREGVFSEGFFDLVIYANEVNESAGLMRKLFIFDERDPKTPLTIIAGEGEIMSEATEDGQRAFLRLKDGNVHRATPDYYTKIDFESYDISLFDPKKSSGRSEDIDTLDMTGLARVAATEKDPKKAYEAKKEWHRRQALPFNCLVFSIIGLGLGAVTNRRSVRSNGLVTCLSVVVVYWILYAAFDAIGKQGLLPVVVAAWLPNLLGLFYGVNRWLKMARV